jgi:hypothetical protein
MRVRRSSDRSVNIKAGMLSSSAFRFIVYACLYGYNRLTDHVGDNIANATRSVRVYLYLGPRSVLRTHAPTTLRAKLRQSRCDIVAVLIIWILQSRLLRRASTMAAIRQDTDTFFFPKCIQAALNYRICSLSSTDTLPYSDARLPLHSKSKYTVHYNGGYSQQQDRR